MHPTIRDIYNEHATEYINEVGDDIQTYELSSLQAFWELLPSNATILDVGCGSGKHAHWLQENGCEVTAVDISDEMVMYAEKHFPSLTVVRGTVQDISEAHFDGIWCLRVFHHIPIAEQGGFLDELSAHLRTEGMLYITAAHDDHDFEVHDSRNGALKKRLTKESFRQLLTDKGLTILNTKEWGNGHSEYYCRKL